MLIHVKYPDNNYDYVKEFMLGNLIENRKITKFRRANGWVAVGLDPVREKKQSDEFNGVEKRSIVKESSHQNH